MEYFDKISVSDNECFKNIILKIAPYVEKYKSVKNLEMEIRMGYVDNKFNADISECFFNKIKDTLDLSPCLKKKNSSINDFFNNGIRKSVTDTDEKIIKKIKLSTFDFKFTGTPFDIRVSFSREIPVRNFDKDNIIFERKKDRNTYNYKCWSYDLTTVTTVENSLKKISYEVELEVNKTLTSILKDVSVYYFLHSTFLKIRDISEICENENGRLSLDFIDENIQD